MTTQKIQPPKGMSPAERKLFARLIADTEDRPVPVELLIDYTRLDSRIRKLSEMAESLDDPKLVLGTYRQLEAAVTQRRQLAAILYPAEGLGKKAAAQKAAGQPGDGWGDLV